MITMVSTSAFEKQEELKARLSKLAEKGLAELYKLASDLKISSEDLLRTLADVQGISPELGRMVDYLWQIRFGKVMVKVPPAELIPPEIIVPEPPKIEIKKCTTFTRLSGLEDKNTLYEAGNYRDVQTHFVAYEDYDGAMDPVCAYIDNWVVKSFRKKDKSMSLVKVPKVSMSTHYGSECPESRRFEYELFEVETGKPRYFLIYTKGKVVKSEGNLPLSEIVSLLKKIGSWKK
jgi:hypothetical protein